MKQRHSDTVAEAVRGLDLASERATDGDCAIPMDADDMESACRQRDKIISLHWLSSVTPCYHGAVIQERGAEKGAGGDGYNVAEAGWRIGGAVVPAPAKHGPAGG